MSKENGFHGPFARGSLRFGAAERLNGAGKIDVGAEIWRTGAPRPMGAAGLRGPIARRDRGRFERVGFQGRCIRIPRATLIVPVRVSPDWRFPTRHQHRAHSPLITHHSPLARTCTPRSRQRRMYTLQARFARFLQDVLRRVVV